MLKNNFEKRVYDTIKKFNLIENGDRIVCGISGGPDSISLLNSLISINLNTSLNFEIIVSHINHGLRENAKIDEEFVKNYCEKHNIKFYVLHADVNKKAEELKRGLEDTGRIVRYEFFNEILEKEHAQKIAIAHNANDNVETIIMNEIRGSGIAGLKGIEPKNKKLIRPLIEIERKDIEEYCKEQNLNPRHDESNDVNIYTRNKVRNIVIPYIKKEFNPNIVETITRLSLLIKDDLTYLDEVTENAYKDILLSENDKEIWLNLKKFNLLNKAIEKRVLLYSITKLFGSTQGIEKIHIEDMVKLCNNNIGNKYLTPNKNLKIVMKNKNIVLIRLN